METITTTREDTLINSILKKTHRLILWNDDINPCDYIVENLIEICGHTVEQADQLTLLAHHRGKAEAKNGEYDDLKVMKDKFTSRKINTTIEGE